MFKKIFTAEEKNALYFRKKSVKALNKKRGCREKEHVERVRKIILNYIDEQSKEGEFYVFISPSSFEYHSNRFTDKYLFDIALDQKSYFEEKGFEFLISENKTYIEINW